MAASLSFQATDTDSTTIGDNGTYTFALTVASAAGQERLVVVGGIGGPAASVDYDACTIDGETATRVGTISRGANDGSNTCAFITFYRAPGTAGTTINVVVTANAPANSVFAGYCGLWTLSNAATLLDTTNAATDDPTLDTDTATSGAAAAAVLGYSGTTPTVIWTGLTEVFDAVRVFGDEAFSGASSDIVTGSTPLAISAAISDPLAESVASICVSFNGGGAVPLGQIMLW